MQGEIFEDFGEKTTFNPLLESFSDGEDEVSAQTDVQDLDQTPIDLAASKQIFKTKKNDSNYIIYSEEGVEDRLARIEFELEEIARIVDSRADKRLGDLKEKLESVRELTKGNISLGRVAGLVSSLSASTLSDSTQNSDSSTFLRSPSNLPNLSKVSIDTQSKTQREIAFEKRISTLEKLVGVSQHDPLALSLQNSLFKSSGTLIGSLQRLDHYLNLLADPVQFEETMKRIHDANNLLDHVVDTRKKNKITSVEKPDEEISFLYSQLTQLDTIGSSIPSIISRLESLQSIHSKMKLYAETIEDFQQEQKTVLAIEQELQKGINGLQQKIESNDVRVKENMKQLYSKLQ